MSSAFNEAEERRAGRKRKGKNSKGSYSSATEVTREELTGESLTCIKENPLAKGIIDTTVQYVVGNGFRLQPMVDAEALEMEREDADAWNDAVLREWSIHFGGLDCDYEGQCRFGDLTALAYKAMLETGDAFVILHRQEEEGSLYDLQLQIIDGTRVANPQMSMDGRSIDGVALTERGKVKGYYVDAKAGMASGGDTTEYRQVGIRDLNNELQIIHLFHKDYAGQKRGLPLLSPALERLDQLDRYSEAYEKLVLMSAMFMAVVKTPDTRNFTFRNKNNSANDGSGSAEVLGEMKPASIVKIDSGEELDWNSPPTPGSNYTEYWNSKAMEIGIGVHLPFEIMTKKFGGSYSASKAAYTDAEKHFSSEQQYLINSFCRPVYREWLTEAISKGRIDAPGFDEDPIKRNAYLESDWITGGKTILDEVRSAAAQKARLEQGITSLQDEVQHYSGKDAKHVLAQRHRELEQMEELKMPPPLYMYRGVAGLPVGQAGEAEDFTGGFGELEDEPVDPDAGMEPDGGEEEVNGGAAEEQ